MMRRRDHSRLVKRMKGKKGRKMGRKGERFPSASALSVGSSSGRHTQKRLAPQRRLPVMTSIFFFCYQTLTALRTDPPPLWCPGVMCGIGRWRQARNTGRWEQTLEPLVDPVHQLPKVELVGFLAGIIVHFTEYVRALCCLTYRAMTPYNQPTACLVIARVVRSRGK